MNDAGREHDRQRCVREGPRERAQAADAAAVTLGGEESDPDLVVRRLSRAPHRQPVPRGTDNEIEGSRALEGRNEPRRIGKGRRRRERAVEKEGAVVETAEIDAHRPRVDADDARHGLSAGALPPRARKE